jgi:BMFP domain-containing protein YqiC
MQSENRFFDDLARLFAGAAGNLTGLRQELETRMREQVERLLRGMDLVSREEFDAVQAMAAKARAEQIQLERRLAALEAQLAAAAGTGAPPPPPDPGLVSPSP